MGCQSLSGLKRASLGEGTKLAMENGLDTQIDQISKSHLKQRLLRLWCGPYAQHILRLSS